MFKRRFAVASAVAVAIYAVAAGASQAAVFTLSSEECNGTVINLCWLNGSKLQELTGTQSYSIAKKAKSSNVVFHGVVAGEALAIECKEVKEGHAGLAEAVQSAPLTSTGTWNGRILFGGPGSEERCVLTASSALAKKCRTSPEVETKELLGEFTSVSELKFVPMGGGAFLELLFENNGTETCPVTIRGSHSVTGFQALTVLSPETAETTKSAQAVQRSGLLFAEEIFEMSAAFTFSFPNLGDSVEVVKKA